MTATQNGKSEKKKVTRVKKKPSKLGHDPLSWLNKADAEQLTGQNTLKHESENQQQAEQLEIQSEHSQQAGEPEINPEEFDEIAEEMDVELEQVGDKTMLELPSYFGIAQVAELHSHMALLIESESAMIEIRAEDVESIDTAALQLLISFIKQIEDQGKTVKWLSCSEKLKTAATLLNICKPLNIAA